MRFCAQKGEAICWVQIRAFWDSSWLKRIDPESIAPMAQIHLCTYYWYKVEFGDVIEGESQIEVRLVSKSATARTFGVGTSPLQFVARVYLLLVLPLLSTSS